MSNKWKYIFGATTITVIIGGVVYGIVKSKQAEKSEEQAISLSEARELVAKEKKSSSLSADEFISNGLDLDGDVHEGRYIDTVEEKKIQVTKASDYDDVIEDFVDSDDPAYDDVDERTPSPTVEPLNNFMYYEEGINPKEDKELRFDPNSVEAKHQFIRMELSDWDPSDDAYRILLQLFEIPFIPTTDGDEVLRTQVIDYKVQFFGFNSRWNKEVSFADIMLHYARNAEFNCGETVGYWVEHFLQFNEFEWNSTSQEMDTLVLRLNSHAYFNEERQTFGLFGLSREGMDQAIRIANRNIDRSVTYEIEFNEFLKSCL